MTLLRVQLARDCMETPWGFRLQGGKDLNQQLVVQRVFANSPSERELQRGDIIVSIGGRDTTNFTHKQAQDAISKGGGQIELLVSRPPPGKVYIKPLTPSTETRAPAFPQVPTKAPQITIPIQKVVGQHSPRVIPVSPQKPAPSQSSPRHAYSDHNMSAAAGHMPTKITMNKYGGGGMDFGYSSSGYGQGQNAPRATSYRPVAAPVPVRDQPDYGSHVQFSAPHQQQQQQQQFSPPVGPEEERGVSEEEYGGVSDRRRQFMTGAPRTPHLMDDYDYPTAPVNERKKLFGNKRQPRPQAVNRSHKPLPTFGRPAPGEQPVTFGLDFSKPQPKPTTQPTKTRERPPAVNARRGDDEADSSWSNTLRGEGGRLKPWEIEALEMDKYQGGTVDQPYRPSMAPAPAPKPKITQITAKSTVQPPADSSGARSVSPYHASRSPVPPQYSPNAYANDVAGGQGGQQGPNIVHLQYNSPMGLYSQSNVRDAYVGQTQPRSPMPFQQQQQKQPQQQQQKPPTQIGDRDWSNSYVYQMIHSSKSTTSQDGQGEPVTHTRVTEEKKFPGQEPQRTVTETVSRGGQQQPSDYKFDSVYGLSDF